MADRVGALDLIEAVVDPGSFAEWDADVTSSDPLGFVDRRPYRERLAEAAAGAGAGEAVVTGRALLDGHGIVLVVGEFAFLAGTMGIAASERVVRAFDRAASLGIGVLGMPVSGGTRMQEGTLAFVQMGRAADAVRRFRERGLPYLVYLRHPTTGGVLASWGSLGHVTFAEPGALIGMTGPRVIEQTSGRMLPEGVQVAENLLAHGLVDAVVEVADLRASVARVLAATCSPPEPWRVDAPPVQLPVDTAVDAWAAVERSRRTDRPGIRELLGLVASDVTPLRGDGAGTDDAGCVAVLARVCGIPAVVLGHDRPPGERGSSLGAAGYRKARRAMELADELGLPLVTVIDTQGAQTSVEAEEGGIAREIARCLATISGLQVPTLSFLLGEGSGGGALAFLPADRIVAAEHAWLAPIAPEGASAILFRTTDRAAELAAAQGIASTDLRRNGIVDVVVQDRPTPDERGLPFAERIAATTAAELGALVARDPAERLAARRARLARLGLPELT